ncbi:MAG: class I SAM-dependent methyltransferase [Magnetovibrio sp.]|nr:class I SAM-dependent methyltransferase [Magnetovibrio sp.]
MNHPGQIPPRQPSDEDWRQALWPDPEAMMRSLGIDFGVSVLDLCCGDGHFTSTIAHIVGGIGRTMAVDIDPQLLDLAKQRAENAGIPAQAIRWLELDAKDLVEQLPSTPNYVLLANSFHSIEDRQQLARNVFNILKPGGQFAIVNWHHRLREDTTVLGEPRGPKTNLRFTPEQVMDEVLPVGFNLHGVVDLPPYHYGILFDKPKVS